MQEIKFVSYNAGRHWMIGPTSYLVDRSLPACEEILLPEAITERGYLRFHITEEKESSNSKVLGKIHNYKNKIYNCFGFCHTYNVNDELILDLRIYSPSNWAHAFTNHLPLALCVRRSIMAKAKENIIIVLPENISNSIKLLFESVNFKVLLSNNAVVGRLIVFDMKPWRSIRCLRHKIVQNELAETKLYTQVRALKSMSTDKLFVSRKDSRRLVNENEVSAFLKSKGYMTVYLEDYTLFEQLSLLSYAKKIVAIHGAGLGPLLLRKNFNNNSFELVEIFTPAHVSDCYRVMTHQLGGKWIGVRGKAWPN